MNKFSDSLTKNALARAGERGITHAVVLSHDLDDYSTLPLETRRDFGMKEMSTMFVQFDKPSVSTREPLDPDGGRPGSVRAGLRFKNLFGYNVKGAFCPGGALIVDGFLEDYQPYVHSLAVIQMIPDFDGYRQACSVIGSLKGMELYASLAKLDDMAVSQHLSDHAMKQLCGVMLAMAHISENPFYDHVHHGSRVPQPEDVMESLFSLCTSYAFSKVPMTGFVKPTIFKS